MTTQGWAPRPGTNPRHVATVMLLAPAVMLVITGILDATLRSNFSWIPTPNSPNANGISMILIPLTLISTTLAFRRISERAINVATLAVAAGGSVALATVCTITHDDSSGAAAMYLLPPITVAFLWSARPAWFITTLTVACAGVHYAMISPPQLALTRWLAVSLLVIGSAALLVKVRTDQQRLHEILRQQSRIDPLTGLLTRQYFDELMGELDQSPQESGVGIFIIDIDHFKHVNDEYGHPTGDAVLAHVAALCQSLPYQHVAAFRLGGDEMCVVLRGLTLDQTCAAADVVTQGVRRRAADVNEAVQVTVSVGVAHWPEHCSRPSQLYVVADAALYNAKHHGRNRMSVFTPTTGVQ